MVIEDCIIRVYNYDLAQADVLGYVSDVAVDM